MRQLQPLGVSLSEMGLVMDLVTDQGFQPHKDEGGTM